MPSWEHPANLPADLAVPAQLAGYVLRRAHERVNELHDDSALLTVAGGDQVAVVCLSSVEQWLEGLVSRAEAGEPL